jgi:hypothetical protein
MAKASRTKSKPKRQPRQTQRKLGDQSPEQQDLDDTTYEDRPKCPRCQSTNTRVDKNRRTAYLNSQPCMDPQGVTHPNTCLRYRVCNECGRKFKTREGYGLPKPKLEDSDEGQVATA